MQFLLTAAGVLYMFGALFTLLMFTGASARTGDVSFWIAAWVALFWPVVLVALLIVSATGSD